MTPDEIQDSPLSPEPVSPAPEPMAEVTFWLKEIALQLALLNQRDQEKHQSSQTLRKIIQNSIP
jgi:hypothetical protein